MKAVVGNDSGRAAAPTTHPALTVFLASTLLFAAAAYAGTLQFPFVYDDIPQIVTNPRVQSWQEVEGYFSGHVWSHYSGQYFGNYYRPVFLLWLRINHALFGLEPFGWHAMVVLLHLQATWLVYLIGKRFLDPVGAAMAALMFGVHPIHAEAVAWVTGVTEPLLAVFFLGALWAFLEARSRRQRTTWTVLATFLYCLALLTKETAIVLPALVAVHLWAESADESGRSGRLARFRTIAWGLTPFLIATTVYLGVRSLVLQGLTHQMTAVSWGQNLLTVPAVLSFYLKKLVIPTGLSLFYEMEYVTSAGSPRFLIPLALLAAVGTGLWFWARRGRRLAVLFATLLLLAPLAPVLWLSRMKELEILHDRYLYLPSVGFALLVAFALRRLASGSRTWRDIPVVQLAVVVLLAVMLTVATWRQAAYWSNDVVLYQRAVDIAPGNAMGRSFLGSALAARGELERAARLHHEALEQYPRLWTSAFTLGWIYYQLEKYQESKIYFSRAIRLDPDNATQFYHYGLVWLKTGEPDQAIGSMREAVRLSPGNTEYRLGLASILRSVGDREGALEQYGAVLALEPGNQSARQAADAVQQELGAPK